VGLDSAKDLRFALWKVELLRNQRTVAEISDRTVSLEVVFQEHAQAHDFDLELEDRDGYFSEPETFQLGDELEFSVWYADRPKPAHMGLYKIDEIRNEDTPSRVRVSGLASDSVRQDFRTLKTRGFEGMTLHQIARQIAKEHNLTPVIEGQDIELLRKDQKEEHDLQFLTRLADDFGYVCRIEDNKLLYLQRGIVEQEPPLSLEGLLERRSFRYHVFRTYRKAKVRYFDPEKKEEIEAVVEDPKIRNVEELIITQRVESREQAETMARERLKLANTQRIEAEFDCLGVPELKGGVNVAIDGEGALFDGVYHITEARHRYDKASGYRVRLKGYSLAGGPVDLT
jgi:phage protein D